MMFNAAPSLKTQPPTRSAAGTVKPLAKPTDAAGGTLVFGASPAAQPPKAPAKDAASGPATMLFGNPPPPVAKVAAAPIQAPPAAPPPAPAQDLSPATAANLASAQDPAESALEAGDAEHAAGGEEPATDGDAVAADAAAAAGDVSASDEVSSPDATGQPPTTHGPPRALVIAVAAAIALVLVLAGIVVAVKKLGHRAPPQAALDTLADARSAADKDTLASLAEAETQANAAIQAAPKARFPEAYAQLAEVEVAWADALDDQAWYWGEKASRALAAGDDKQKTEAEAKASTLQDAAKARLKTGFEAAAAGNKIDPKSPEVALALADYYRAAHSRLNLNRELKRAALLQADEARIAFVQGAELLGQDEGAARALEKLKVALAASPRSARVRFRVAMAYLALHQDGEAKKELLETLKLSPQHERARMAMELLAPPSAAPPAAASEGKKG